MKTKIISLIALVLLLVGIFGAIATFPNSNFKGFVKSGQYFVDETKKIGVTNSYPDQSIANLDIDAESLKIDFQETDASTISWTLEGYTKKTNLPEVHAIRQGDTLHLDVEPNPWFFFSTFIWNDQLTLTVYIPKNMKLNTIEVESDSGVIVCKDVTASNWKISMDSGKLDMSDIVADRVEIETDSGIVNVDRVKAALIDLNLDSGKMNVKNVLGDMKVEMDSGMMNMTDIDLDQNIDIQVDSGIINVNSNTKPQNASFRVNVDSGYAEIFGQSIKGSNTTIGTGDHLIQISVDSGKVTIK